MKSSVFGVNEIRCANSLNFAERKFGTASIGIDAGSAVIGGGTLRRRLRHEGNVAFDPVD